MVCILRLRHWTIALKYWMCWVCFLCFCMKHFIDHSTVHCKFGNILMWSAIQEYSNVNCYYLLYYLQKNLSIIISWVVIHWVYKLFQHRTCLNSEMLPRAFQNNSVENNVNENLKQNSTLERKKCRVFLIFFRWDFSV